MGQTNADYTIDESINNLSISELIEDDTFNNEFDNSLLTHPNMAILTPHPQSPSTVSRLNARPSVVTSDSPHPNRVLLSYPTQLSLASQRGNQFVPTSLTSTSHIDRFQLASTTSVFNHSNLRQPIVTSNLPHPNTVQLSYPPQLSVVRSRTNRLQGAPSISATHPIQRRTNTNIDSSSRHQPNVYNRLP